VRTIDTQRTRTCESCGVIYNQTAEGLWDLKYQERRKIKKIKRKREL
jgi:hypothetical protein